MMDAYLFDGSPLIQLLPEALNMGGSWQQVSGGTSPPLPYDSDLIRRVYEALKDIPDALLVDVGANTGSFSLLPAILPNLSVVAFEPNSAARQLLVQMGHLNGLDAPRLSVFPVGLSNSRGAGLLSIPKRGESGCATFGAMRESEVVRAEVVPLARLDDMTWNRRIHLIKIDVECMEKQVLEGGADTIAEYRPALLVECTPETQRLFGYDCADIPALIERYGYALEWANEGNIWGTPL